MEEESISGSKDEIYDVMRCRRRSSRCWGWDYSATCWNQELRNRRP